MDMLFVDLWNNYVKPQVTWGRIWLIVWEHVPQTGRCNRNETIRVWPRWQVPLVSSLIHNYTCACLSSWLSKQLWVVDVESCQTTWQHITWELSVFKCRNVFLKASVNENPSCLIYANPLFSPLLLISFSSIKLTVLVTHDGVHYHDNEGNDGRGEERSGGGVYGEV